MNNNYHTQVDKQNMLNEIAANKQLLQQNQQNPNLQSFPGTPINRNMQNMQDIQIPQQTQYPNYLPNITQYQNPNQQPINKQYQPDNIEPDREPRVPLRDNRTINSNMMGNKYPPTFQEQQDEIELSEAKPLIPPIQDIPISPKMPLSHPQNPQNPKNPGNPGNPGNQIVPYPNRRPHPGVPPKYHKPPENKMVKYFIIPLLLVIVFIALVHPTTSKYLEKYLPSMKDMKGVFVRGAILAIVYIAIIVTNDKLN